MSHTIITGVPSSLTQGALPPPRLEINTLIKDDVQFSLYIQALQQLYSTDQSQPTSHFSIGGIHGLPYTRWEGAGGSRAASSFGGYCTHGSVLFPTWHRPYVALYEQAMQQKAVQVASQYQGNDKAKWQDAATRLRAPYWDWATNSVPPSQVISDQQVSIITPTSNGQKVKVNNPLLGYHFNPIDKSFPSPFSRWPTTLRHPRGTAANAVSDVNEMIDWLRGDQHDIRDSTFNLLTRVDDWQAFSNHGNGDGGSGSNSLEAIHDGIHVNVGGSGHMANTAVAGFDPLFFLHHANVDRIFALWQALHPDVWVTPGRSPGTFTAAVNSSEDANTDLTPFWSNASGFWKSAVVRDTTRLGYTYPEFVGVDLGNKDAVRSAIGQKVNQLYGDGSRNSFAFAAASTGTTTQDAKTIDNQTSSTKSAPDVAQQIFGAPTPATSGATTTSSPPAQGSSTQSPPSADATLKSITDAIHTITLGATKKAAEHLPQAITSKLPHLPAGLATTTREAPVVLAAQPSQQPINQPTPPSSASSGGQGHQYHDWAARIRFKKSEMPSSFSVLIFVGQVPEDPRQWRSSSSYVGSHYGLVNSEAGQCDNCRNNEANETEGYVHLNHWMATFSGLKSFEPNVVKPYLAKYMTWRIHMADGSTPEISSLPSLQVIIVETQLGFKKGDMFPRRGAPVHHHDITEGRPGGHRPHPAGEAHH